MYIENTEDTDVTTSDLYPTGNMKQVYGGQYTLAAKIGSSTDREGIIKVDFSDTPIVYTGGNLRIVVKIGADVYIKASNEVMSDIYNTAAFRRKDDGVLTGTLSEGILPVLYLAVDKEATTVSGTVTAQKDGSAIAGAEVVLESGDVKYSGTTDEAGKYDFAVYQDRKEYTMTVAKDGYFKVEIPAVDFADGSVVKDVAMDESTGFQFKQAAFPATGEVNSPLAVKASILNGQAKEAGSYVAQLYVDGAVAAVAEAVALEADAVHEFEFVYTPHAAGTVSAYVQFAGDYNAVASEPAEIVIAEETASADVQVGTVTSMENAGPVKLYNNVSLTEMIYPKDMIGLAAGTKIISVKYKGYHSSKQADFLIKAWIENADGGTFKDGSTDGMTQIADIVFSTETAIGSSSETGVEVNIGIPDGFVYEGGDIRIVMSSESDKWCTVKYEVDGSVKNCAQQKY